MRMEVLGVVALGLLATACSSGDDQRAATSDLGGVGSLTATNLGPMEESGNVRRAQSELKREGLYASKVDGIAGPETTQGIIAFRQREGLQQTARLDRATRDRIALRALRMDGRPSETAQSGTATERSGSSMPQN
jgi:peptidoglycan hydrolase-like protein with peptidoglycan-binding domain